VAINEELLAGESGGGAEGCVKGCAGGGAEGGAEGNVLGKEPPPPSLAPPPPPPPVPVDRDPDEIDIDDGAESEEASEEARDNTASAAQPPLPPSGSQPAGVRAPLAGSSSSGGGGGGGSAGGGSGGSGGDPAGGGGVLIKATPRDRVTIAPLPARLAPPRGVDPLPKPPPMSLHGWGCVPWHGAIASPGELDRGDRHAVGRWGEALVHNYLKATLPPSHCVTWLNQSEETKAPYDLTISPRGQTAHRGGGKASGGSVFCEVKTTRYADHNAFELSYFEWQFMASEPPVEYHIYRVCVQGPTITVIEDPLQAIKDGRVRLCMAV
jgi:hypothetical protein